MKCPIPLKLSEVALGGFLVVNLELLIGNTIVVTTVGGAEPDLDLPELLGGEAESELVAAALVLEAVDAAEGLGDGDVEDEVGDGEQRDGDPAVTALEARGLGLGEEEESEEDEENLKELVKLLLLKVYGPFLLQGLLEVKLDYGVQSLKRCFFRHRLLVVVAVVVVVVVAGFVVCHGWKRRNKRWVVWCLSRQERWWYCEAVYYKRDGGNSVIRHVSVGDLDTFL
ncbi:hypothetical protein LR48_Vigan04g134400 [Vigna angularis]|uniref:Uncharacterized protein n=1 Tax=Phaseolus angularis TaxID=3914 RepID=A0A0L9UEK2_PHAAN|nr:hypothetical protein LR48_Vigan04g134400 [Vigna angularis]